MYFFKGFLCTVIICNIFMVPSYSKRKENIQKQLSEILSNISVANKKLKDLLSNNYYLRNNNKSIKALKNQSSDSEIDQLYKSIASDTNENKIAKRKHQGITTTRSHKVQVTAAIYDSSETSNRPTQDKGKSEIKKYDESETHSEYETVEVKVSDQEIDKTIEVSKKPRSKNVKIHKKTRFDVKNNRDEKNADDLAYTARANDSRRIKKIVHFETFPKDKMWHEVARKPIAYNRQREQENTVNNLISDTGGDLPAPYFEESEEKGDVILNVLRHKYGDACMYVAVRKCYKALRLVKKDVCDGRHRCNSKKRNTFDFKSRTGCIREFGDEKKHNKNTHSIPIEPPTTTKSKKKYYPGACRSLDAAEYLNLQQVTSNISTTNLNILRDKYEDRCRNISNRKCVDACTFAYKETCTALKCRRNERDAFKRRCKVRCREEYIEMSSEDRSKSDTYTDTDTKTETDTDTDYYTY